MRRQVPMLIVFLSGLTMLCDYFFPRMPYVHGTREIFLNWGRVALTCGMILGILNLLISNFKKVMLQSPGWAYNLLLLASFAVTFYFAIPYHVIVHGATVTSLKGTDVGTTGFQIFMYVYTPLSATMFALVAFYIASAAFRAFRAKNVESVLLILSAIFVMIGSIPFGDMVFNFFGLSRLFGAYNATWLSNQIQLVPMSAGMRAIQFGVAIGMISISVKILGGLDRSYFGGGTEDEASALVDAKP